MGQLCPFPADVFLPGLHELHSSLSVESKSDNETVTVPENSEWEVAPEGKVGTAYLILSMWAWRKCDVI